MKTGQKFEIGNYYEEEGNTSDVHDRLTIYDHGQRLRYTLPYGVTLNEFKRAYLSQTLDSRRADHAHKITGRAPIYHVEDC